MMIALRGLTLEELQGALSSAHGAVDLQVRALDGLVVAVAREDGMLLVRDLQASSVGLSFRLPLASGHLAAGALRLLGVKAELRLPPGAPWYGTLSAETATLADLELVLGGRTLRAQARADGLHYTRSPDGQSELSIRALSFESLHLHEDALTLRASAVLLGALAASFGAGPLALTVGELAADALSLRAGGIQLDAPKASAAALSIGPAGVTLGTLAAEQAGLMWRAGPPATTPPTARPPLDWHLLDGLQGKLHADLNVIARIPVLGRRDATHRFRIPIQGGALNYRALLNDLAFLEGAFLDFAVSGGALVLQRDIPLVPDIPKPIVSFSLDPDGLALARQDLVPLRALTQPRLAASDEPEPTEKKPSSVALERLHAKEIDLEVALHRDPGAPALEGLVPQLVFGGLRVQGAVLVQPGQEPAPSELTVHAHALSLALRGLPLGPRALHLGALTLARLDHTVLTLLGPRPHALRASLHSLLLHSLSF